MPDEPVGDSFPGPAAMDWLARHEEVRSGWYSGGFGIMKADGDGEFRAALRPALIAGNRVELHAGPELELAETDTKIGTLLATLGSIPAGKRSASG